MFADIVFVHINKLYTPFHKPPVKGRLMRDVLVFDNAFVAVKNGSIVDFGSFEPSKWIGPATEVVESDKYIMLPGLIDSHTHLVHFGFRENEALKIAQGIPYIDILKQGGGILSTVKATRNASFDQLFEKAKSTLDRMLSFGVTTLETKSGYGLDSVTEYVQLEVSKKLNQVHPIDIHSTYLGAHAIPLEYKEHRKEYIEKVKQDLQYIKEKNLAEAVDVFMEDGVFSYEETKDILSTSKRYGFNLHLHADEMISLGGAGLGVELGANSVDHLMAISEKDIKRLADSFTVGNILPTTSFFLNKDYAPARNMIDQGAALSVSSDYNPGSAPSENFQFALQLAFSKLKMLPLEVLTSATINPAFHLGVHDQVGSIEIGKKADLILFEAPNLEVVLLDFGVNHVKKVYINGILVFQNS